MSEMAFHDAANIFPLDDEHLNELADDIKANGLLVPIEVLDGKIIDGRRRWLACLTGNVKPKLIKVETDDPIKYVLSLNLHRRHLTPSQLSMVAARTREMYDQQAEQRMLAGKKGDPLENLPQGTARDQAGKVVGVSGKSVDHATKVLNQGTPELVKAVDDGRMAVSTAAILASESPEVQKREVANPRLNRRYGPGGGGSRKGENPTGASEEDELPEGVSRGVGVAKANEAIDCLRRIPKNDRLRKRGFQIVTDWIRHNK